MALTSEQLTSFLDNAVLRISKQIRQANAYGELNNLAEKLGLSDLLEEVIPCCDFYDRNRSKILVLAFAFPNKDEWLMRAKKAYPSTQNRIEFVEYTSNFNYESLRYTDKYSDIFVGPIPHKGVGIGDESSFLAAVANNPAEYPKVHRMTDSNGTLKISLNSFMKCLEESNFVKECL